MSVAPLRLFKGLAPNPLGTIYTVPGGLSVVVRHIFVVNTSAANSNVTVNVGGVAVFASEQVPANKRLDQWLSEALTAGDTITALSSAAGALSLRISGFTY